MKYLLPWKLNIFSLTEQGDVVGIYNWKDAGLESEDVGLNTDSAMY